MLRVDEIKRLAIIAMASDDTLVETLVLKGGNAIDLMYREKDGNLSRASYDLDFSISGDFDETLSDISDRIERTLIKTFLEQKFVVFDYKFSVKPSVANEQVKDFWGGYNVSFKLATPEAVRGAAGNLDKLRRTAMGILPNGSTRFEIEISKYEYTGGKVEAEVDGYHIFIYSAEMIVFEKLRAICQQLLQYAEVIPSHSPRPRARDFYDIYLLMNQHQINAASPDSKQLLQYIFEAKRVPTRFIKLIKDNLNIHRQDWQSVLDTLSAKEEVKSFDFYVDFVCSQFELLTFP